MSKKIQTPIPKDIVKNFKVGDSILLSGKIFAGRDAVLPRIVNLYKQGLLYKFGLDLEGGVIFHSAVSIAGTGPTSSNKLEIETSIPDLSEAGIRIHLGKGAVSQRTVEALKIKGSVYAVIPPITALLEDRTLSKKIVAYPELGMEAFYQLEVIDIPIIIAVANGESIY